MDRTCTVIEELAAWVAAEPAPPVIFAAHYQGESRNRPSPYLGLTWQLGAVCPWWELGGTRFDFPPDSLMVLSARDGSRSAPVQASGDEGLWVCTFDIGGTVRFDDWLADYVWEPRAVRQPTALRAAYERLARARLQTGPRRHLHLRGALLSLFATMLDDLSGSGQPQQGEDRVALAMDYLHQHYREPELDLGALAAAAALSPDHFGRVFRQATGETPMALLHRLRIRQAQALLLSTDLRIGEIAREVGYRDPLHFSRRFRDATGRSPRAWRRLEAEGWSGRFS